jgi:hypothetical protein
MSEGKKNDSGKAPIHFLTREFIEGVAQAQAFGAKKYGDYNFCNGLAYTRLLDAAMRHLIAFTWGEDNDNESGESHLSHAAANINMLMYTIKNHPELDDRYKEPNQNLTIFTTEDEINNMIKHKGKFVAKMGEELYYDLLDKLKREKAKQENIEIFSSDKNKHTGSSFDDFLKELESSYEEASTKVEGTLDKEDIIQDLKYPYTENWSSVPSGRSRGQRPIHIEPPTSKDYTDAGLNKEQFLKFSTDCVCGEINARHCPIHQEDKE